MSNNNIIVLYNYLAEENKKASYYILNVLHKTGVLEKSLTEESYKNLFHSPLDREYIGPFQSIEDLQRYSFNLCEKLEADQAAIISAQEYNGMVERISDVAELREQVFQIGDTIHNPTPKKRRFLDKLFH